MAGIAIDVCHRMTDRWITGLIIWGHTMAGIAPVTHNGIAGMVGVCSQETGRGMAVTAFRVGDRVCAGGDVICGRRLTSGHSAIVAAAACPANIRMIKAAIRISLQKCNGIVAVIALGIRWRMKLRFTDGYFIIVTLAAITKNFLMIDSRDNVESLGCMTALAHVTGTDVYRPFTRNRNEIIVMTIHAI